MPFSRSFLDISGSDALWQACKTASDPWLGPCTALTTLLQASRKACEVVVKSEGFALPKAGTPAGESARRASCSEVIYVLLMATGVIG